ncbi:MAG TPA: hypothetical protein GXZ30_06195 [Propionibacterium sp.]|jgi:tetratricopeptide (TPR) repeat protein|nr:hypothetical protein [Propionibacterium sp.]
MPQDPHHDHEDMDDAVAEKLDELVRTGTSQLEAGDNEAALASFQAGLDLLDEPKDKWVAAVWLYASVANIHFEAGRWQEARDNFTAASNAPGGLSNAYIQLRRGQAEYELGNMDAAAHHLLFAQMRGPKGLLDDQDPKYRELVERARAQFTRSD